MDTRTLKRQYAKVPNMDMDDMSMDMDDMSMNKSSKSSMMDNGGREDMFIIDKTGTKLRARLGEVLKVNLPGYKFWNLINIGQTLHWLWFSFMAFSAVGELTMHDFLSIEEWWGAELGLWVLTLAATLLPPLQHMCTTTFHANDHEHPFYVHVTTQVVQHTILFALLTYFQFGLSTSRRDAFAHARYGDATGFDFFTGALWYSIMILIITFYTSDVHLMMDNWLRHGYQKFKATASREDLEGENITPGQIERRVQGRYHRGTSGRGGYDSGY